MIRRPTRLFLSLLVFCFLVIRSSSSVYAFPDPTGFVNDFADVLPVEYELELEKKLADFSTQVGPEVVVVTINSLEGDIIENYAVELFAEWGIGKKETDTGVLFISSIGDRKMRIDTGYGVEGFLPDGKVGRILRDSVAPNFKEQDYQAGIDAGVGAILSALESDPNIAPISSTASDEIPNLPFMIFIVIFFAMALSYSAAFMARSKSFWFGGAVGFFIGLFSGVGAAVFLGLFGLFLDFILSQNYKTLKKTKRPTSFWKSKGGFGGFGGKSSGGGGFGGFSGGSSGGGGASSSW